MIQRGCGFPIAGGIYLKTDINQTWGTPWQYFVYDPPIPVYEPEAMGISAQGISFLEDGDHYNAVDWIGASHYPYVPCFLEEGLKYGFSRRVPKTADFTKLTPESKHILIHRNGLIIDPHPYYKNRMYMSCPKRDQNPEHWSDSDWMCFDLLWEAMDTGKRIEGREFQYKMPSFSFRAWQSPHGVEPEFQLAAFMWLPIGYLEVVYDKVAGTHEKALDVLKNSGTDIPYSVEDYGEETDYDNPITVTVSHKNLSEGDRS